SAATQSGRWSPRTSRPSWSPRMSRWRVERARAGVRTASCAVPSQGTSHEIKGATVIDETLLEAEEKMEKAVSVAKEDFGAIRTGRAHPSLFSKIMVDYYGTPTPLNQLASFHVVDARMM